MSDEQTGPPPDGRQGNPPDWLPPMAASSEHEERDRWRADALAWVRKHAAAGHRLTAEDLGRAVPLPDGVHHNHVGGVFATLRWAEELQPVGDHYAGRTRSHGRRMRLWEAGPALARHQETGA